jgi:hypothetical protein
MEVHVSCEEDVMPVYISRFSYTADAWAALARNPVDRGAS